MEIKAKVTGGPEVTVFYDVAEDLDGLVDQLGAATVYSKAVDSLVIDVQALVRRHAKGTEKVPPKSEDEIQAIVDAYKPGAGRVKKSPAEKVGALIAALSPEEKASLLASLRG